MIGAASAARLAEQSPAAAGDASIENIERLLRRHLEELHFSFGDEPLVDVQGFLIAEDGCRAIITASDLDAYARVFLYLHCLGHLALGHVDDSRLHLGYEFRDRWRLPPHLQAREAAADCWALQLLEQRPGPSASGRTPFQQSILRELHNLRVPRGFLRACLERLRGALTAMGPDLVQQLQRQATARQAPALACGRRKTKDEGGRRQSA